MPPYDGTLMSNQTENSDNSESTKLVERNVKIASKTTPGTNEPDQVKVASKEYKIELAWFNIAAFIYLHGAAYYGLFGVSKSWSTIISAVFYGLFSSFGISSGAHRYFCHKTYKANMKLKVLLVILQTIAFQNSVLEWVRDHRVHHKFSDTNADPHNAQRGFFFSHMGWLMCKKHPDVKAKGATIDMSDLSSDPLLKFQHKYYIYLVFLLSFALPIFLTCYFLGESFNAAWHFHMFRYVLSLHITWSINSVSHLWGSKPFEKDIKPTDTYIIGFLAFGEGWHNYHHVFPWDYKVSELSRYWCNFSIAFIDFFAWIGWATDLKTVSDEMIRKRVLRTGDGTHRYSKAQTTKELLAAYDQNNNNNNNNEDPFGLSSKVTRDVEHFWGYGDDDMLQEDLDGIKILHKKFDN